MANTPPQSERRKRESLDWMSGPLTKLTQHTGNATIDPAGLKPRKCQEYFLRSQMLETKWPLDLQYVGVKIDNDTCNMASILLLSLVPFAVVLLLLVFNNRIIVLIALIVSVLSFCYYIRYQIKHPRIQAKSVTFLKEEEFQKKFLLKLKGPKNESVYTNKGHPDTEVIKSIFKSRDADNDGYLKRSELENFIRDTFDNEEEHIFRQYALDEILRHFDKDSTQSLTMMEFEEGCTSWLNKWSVTNKGLGLQKASKFQHIYCKCYAYIYVPNPSCSILFSHDVNKDDEMNYEELETAIVELKITEQDAGAFAKSMIAALDTNKSGTLSKEEVITGLKKLTEMANTTVSGHNDLVTLFQRYVCEMMGLVNDKEGFDWNILYILLGAGTLYLFAGPFMQSVIQFSSALQIPFLFTSFVVAPFFMNARSMVIYAFSFSSKKNSNRSGSLKFFELYSGLIMNNLMGLTTLLAIVYAKDLTWSYTPEVVTIIAIGLIMGTFARSCKTYPLWTSVLAGPGTGREANRSKNGDIQLRKKMKFGGDRDEHATDMSLFSSRANKRGKESLRRLSSIQRSFQKLVPVPFPTRILQ
ncbi:sodium/calcium exchanger NCL1-like protein [Tanacetum coccineum]